MRKYAAPSRDKALLAMAAIGRPATTREITDQVCRMFGYQFASAASNAIQAHGPKVMERCRYIEWEFPRESDWPMRYRLSPRGRVSVAEIRNERETAARVAEKGTDDGREDQDSAPGPAVPSDSQAVEDVPGGPSS